MNQRRRDRVEGVAGHGPGTHETLVLLDALQAAIFILGLVHATQQQVERRASQRRRDVRIFFVPLLDELIHGDAFVLEVGCPAHARRHAWDFCEGEQSGYGGWDGIGLVVCGQSRSAAILAPESHGVRSERCLGGGARGNHDGFGVYGYGF